MHRGAHRLVGVVGAFAGLMLTGHGADRGADAFLDQPLPATFKLDSFSAPPASGSGPWVKYPGVQVSNLPDGVGLLQRLSGRKIVLPVPFAACVQGEIRTQEHPRQGAFWGVQAGRPVRDLFNRICMSMELLWHDGANPGEIVCEMKWWRDDPRSGAQLVQVLDEVPPVPWEQLKWGPTNLVGGHDQVLDPWRVAFDALLSKPENFNAAGQVRIYHDEHAEDGMATLPVTNLLSQKMRDASGRAETLVLNTHPGMSNKCAPGEVAYYLFDQDGRFTRGGVYAMGEGAVGSIIKAQTDSENAITIDVGWGSFAMSSDHAHFALRDGDLVLTGATSSKGEAMTADEARQVEGPPNWHGAMGVLKMKISG